MRHPAMTTRRGQEFDGRSHPQGGHECASGCQLVPKRVLRIESRLPAVPLAAYDWCLRLLVHSASDLCGASCTAICRAMCRQG